jgi:serine phosphatase RsbU (regulator of sigma subunit)
VGEHRVFVVVGDVSGHGLRAATTMASLRHATLAYAAQENSPATVLTRLAAFVNSAAHDYFATVLCALIDVDAHEVTIASAGHLAPLLIDGDDTGFLDCVPGVPIGVSPPSSYREKTFSVGPRATLVAFTDGLVERRGETLDTGLERLRSAAAEGQLAIEELLAKLVHDLASAYHHDDTAVMGIRWQH